MHRTQPSGAQNRKRKRQQQALTQSLQGSLNKFLVKPQSNANVNENLVEENNVEENDVEINDGCENCVEENNVEKNKNENENNKTFGDNANQSPIKENNECLDSSCDNRFNCNIFDVRIWDGLSSSMKDLLVSKWPPARETNLEYPKDKLNRHFSDLYYLRTLLNNDTTDRKWLVYSKELDKVFCFCCKLFKNPICKSELGNVGINDWRHLSEKLKNHESSSEHMKNLETWAELRMRLNLNQTIDKELQELIKKDTDHWKEVLVRIIATVKCLVVYNFPFRVSKKFQSKDMLLDVAIQSLDGLVTFFDNYRETGFDKAIIEAKKIAETIDVEPEFPVKRVSFDMALSQLKTRFEQMKHFETIFDFMFDASKLYYLDDDLLKTSCLDLETALTYEKDSDIDGDDLFRELQSLQKMLPKGAYEGAKPWTSLEIMEFTKKLDIFPNILLAYKILLTVPVTVVSAERSFSKLKLLKNYLRNTMSQDRLNGLAIISIENRFLSNVDYDKMIEVFASKNARRHHFR
ncbi:uncharacterized protein [Rutidosis leptorrhynchoides]|uniref:uncharacterized protein n=1 Tax=Rutidosis leptorrhynchoides TaxID=125765 RepID=UPI003A98FD06